VGARHYAKEAAISISDKAGTVGGDELWAIRSVRSLSHGQDVKSQDQVKADQSQKKVKADRSARGGAIAALLARRADPTLLAGTDRLRTFASSLPPTLRSPRLRASRPPLLARATCPLPKVTYYCVENTKRQVSRSGANAVRGLPYRLPTAWPMKPEHRRGALHERRRPPIDPHCWSLKCRSCCQC
jgi:hypothetical protein